MAIQYPKTTHVTLPSVEKVNILRDPPRSITTRRVDREQLTTRLNELIDGSGDRACETIRVYARGVNPMVSVEYSNVSNNAGSRISVGNNFVNGGLQNTSIPVRSASLPYKAFDNGAFRPPIRGPRDLLPLSRLPRAWFTTMAQPGYVDYSKTKYCPTKFRMIKDLLNTFELQPTKSVKLEKPIMENYRMMESVNERHINVEADAGTNTLGSFLRDQHDLGKGINDNVIEAYADTNPSLPVSHGLEGIEINRSKYTHDFLNYSAATNPSIEGTTQTLDQIGFNEARHIQNPVHYQRLTNPTAQRPGVTFLGDMGTPELSKVLPAYSLGTNVSDPTIQNTVRHHNELQYRRNLPQTSAATNNVGTQQFEEASSRSVRLNPTASSRVMQSFSSGGAQPTFERAEVYVNGPNPEREKMRKFLNEQQFGRW